MITCIRCPVCDSGLELDATVKVNSRLHVDGRGGISEKRELSGINVRKIVPVENKWLTIIEQIRPYIRPGLTTDELSRILTEEYNVCTVHTAPLIERIKEAYGLYAKDGRTLEKI